MSEEEKKAVFYLKDLENDKEHLIIEQRQAITTILNLIEKQQKEIEARLEEIDSLYKMMSAKDERIEELYVSKDKIKEKIEEYKKKCDECNFQNTGVCKEFKVYYNCSIQSVLELLKELLGE